MRRLFFLLCLLIVQMTVMAQSTKISGRITDVKTKEPLSGASVVAKATGIGFRNYWVSVIRRTIMEIDWSNYKDWKKKYSH